MENIENGEWYLSKNIASCEFSLLCEYSKFEGAKGLNSTDHEVFNQQGSNIESFEGKKDSKNKGITK